MQTAVDRIVGKGDLRLVQLGKANARNEASRRADAIKAGRVGIPLGITKLDRPVGKSAGLQHGPACPAQLAAGFHHDGDVRSADYIEPELVVVNANGLRLRVRQRGSDIRQTSGPTPRFQASNRWSLVGRPQIRLAMTKPSWGHYRRNRLLSGWGIHRTHSSLC
jgi:hypothetical protein